MTQFTPPWGSRRGLNPASQVGELAITSPQAIIARITSNPAQKNITQYIPVLIPKPPLHVKRQRLVL